MTSDVNMINLQVIAADQIALDKTIFDKTSGKSLYEQNIASNSKFYSWQSEFQTIPMGMDGEPRQFAQKLRESLPEVNNLRLLFNEFSFDENGQLHPQYKAFLKEAAAQGFDLTFVYGGGDAQNTGNSGSPWGHKNLTNAQAFTALEDNYSDVHGAFAALLDWLDDNGRVKDAVYGYELINEAAGYRRSIKENGGGDGLDYTDFVKLYADHMIELSDFIQDRAEGRILVGGWGYSGDFTTLQDIKFPTGSALDYIREGIGDALVWSAHLYPGWAETSEAVSPKKLKQILQDHFEAVLDDDLLITETNANGSVDDITGGETPTDHFVAMYEWFADNDIGIGWFPGAETGKSNFVVIDEDGSLRFLHQHSYAHGMNAFSLGDNDPAGAGDDRIKVTLIAGKLRNEGYETDYSKDAFDTERFLGTAFGFGGDDKIIGTKISNDFIYGGFGDDRLLGKGGDDFLFGQQDDDVLIVTRGINHLFGGSGDDWLHAGRGYDQMHGGVGKDVFVTNGAGRDVVTDFSVKQDMIKLLGRYSDWADVSARLVRIDADEDGKRDDVEISMAGKKSLTLLNVKVSALSADNFLDLKAQEEKAAGPMAAVLDGFVFQSGQGRDTTPNSIETQGNEHFSGNADDGVIEDQDDMPFLQWDDLPPAVEMAFSTDLI